MLRTQRNGVHADLTLSLNHICLAKLGLSLTTVEESSAFTWFKARERSRPADEIDVQAREHETIAATGFNFRRVTICDHWQ